MVETTGNRKESMPVSGTAHEVPCGVEAFSTEKRKGRIRHSGYWVLA